MASADFARGSEALGLSIEHDILREPIPVPCLSRRGTSSTTGSGKALPPGHWTFPLSGNCPNCHHHHRSLKVHVRKTDDSSNLADVRCEKCDKLWLGSGGRNSTRISLASVETIEPPPTEPEARTAFFHAIRAVTRVGTLSQDLPIIPETIGGPSRVPSGRDPNKDSAEQRPADPPEVAFVDANKTASNPQLPTTGFPNGGLNASMNNAKAARTRQLLSSVRRRLASTRLSRLPLVTKLLGEGHLSTVGCTQIGVNNVTAISRTALAQLPEPVRHAEEDQTQGPLLKEVYSAKTGASNPERVEGSDLSAAFDRDAFVAMSPEQRFAFVRKRVTALSAQHLRPDSSRRISSPESHGSFLDDLTTALLGVGDVFDRYNAAELPGDADSSLPRRSLQISDTRTSEAPTIVDGQIYAPENLFREVLNRAYRLSGLAEYPVVADGSNGNDHEANGRSSLDSIVTAAASITSGRGRAPHRRSQHSVGRRSMLPPTERANSQPNLSSSHEVDTVFSQDTDGLSSPP
ncbi:hypothetical protein E8E12_004803 [Didymella heteroderae]|uniref:Uncharacterized protein n=1 Tax=Didymella heteroderae TaxID=1769908 RepID=A0A9P4WIP1_9PLEO|nr:hypothetical protein E8E12_004803 [Didymella heteroderae]